MKQITAINFMALRNEEFEGLQREGLKFAKEITDKDILPVVATYEKAYLALENFLEASVTETKAKQAQALDAERNNVYAACRKVAKAAKEYPDESAREIGALIWKVFDENDSPIHINQQQSTGILTNIIKGIRKIGDEQLETCGFKVWLDKLESVNNQYVEADMARFTERGQRELEYCKKLRATVVEAYKLVCMAATVKANTGSESCKQFVDSMDAAIVAKKQQLNIRKGHTKPDGEPVFTDSTAVNQTESSVAENAA